MSEWTRERIEAADKKDPLAGCRDRFQLPDGVIYLDGNSLGALPKGVTKRLQDMVENEWGHDLIKSWNVHHWIDLSDRVGARIAPLIGANPTDIVVADSTSINLYKVVMGALALNPSKTKILTESSNFPTDIYMMEGIVAHSGRDLTLEKVAFDDAYNAIDEKTSVVVLTQVNYKTGAIHDMAKINAKAREMGALVVWDLAHSAGAIPVDLNGTGSDFAVGCGYKYLNGGPGAPAFLFVSERHQESVSSPLSGWMGHESPFEFSGNYRPAKGAARMKCGTPSVLSLGALEQGLMTFDGVDMQDVREKSMALGQIFQSRMDELKGKYGFKQVGPEHAENRGSQIGYGHEHGFAMMQALIDHGVIGDFRAPDVMRFGFAPLYVRYADVWNAMDIFSEILEKNVWKDPKYHVASKVT